jgi:hypothetical protein
MHNTAGNHIEIEAGDRNGARRAVVSDLVSLIEHVRASLKLIEHATVQETSLGDQTCVDVFVLDDVTPRYLKAAAALNACDINLGIALHSLQDSNISQRGTRESRQPALSIIRG